MIRQKYLLFLVVALVSWRTNSTACAEAPNTLSASEQASGFHLLFNGKELDSDWKHSGNWHVSDGAIARKSRGGSLSYTQMRVPEDFEFRFEWKVGAGSNSGVYYRPGQYEYQILDNGKHPDGRNPRTSAASLYFCMQPSHDATKPVGEWNAGKIVCQGTVIQHWLNGSKVVGFDYADAKYAFNVDLLKKRGGNLSARSSFVTFQDHGDPVWYRNVKMRALTAADKLDRTPVKPAKIAQDVLDAEAKKLQSIIERRKTKK